MRALSNASMRASYLAEDRIDVRYVVKEVCRMIATSDEAALQALKLIVRYLFGQRRLRQRFPLQRVLKEFVGSTGADFAGCLCTRHSTSCAVSKHEQHMIEMLPATPKVIDRASAESEY